MHGIHSSLWCSALYWFTNPGINRGEERSDAGWCGGWMNIVEKAKEESFTLHLKMHTMNTGFVPGQRHGLTLRAPGGVGLKIFACMSDGRLA